MIRVVLPAHLRKLAQVDGEVEIEVAEPVTLGATLDALERRYPVLQGTIRDHDTLRRRPFLRFFACEEDLSLEPPDIALPPEVCRGAEPFLIIGAISGGEVYASTSGGSGSGCALVVSPVSARRR